MTQKRRDNNSTEFGLWLREQNKIHSAFGYVTTNIDYLWTNYRSKYWMLLEEKRHGQFPKCYQLDMYKVLDRAGLYDENYKGFHVLTFENTSPDDGGIFLDGKFINVQDLLDFLRFEKPSDWYKSWFPGKNVDYVSFGRKQK